MSQLENALEYLLKYKFSVIPWKKDKRGSLIPTYKEYQGRLPTEEEVRNWFTQWPDAMIGVVAGPISDLIAIDIDLYKIKEKEKAAIYDLIPHTLDGPIAISPEGGNHRLFRYPDKPLDSKNGILPGLDIKALKGVITMPPSINEKGLPYRWMPGRSLMEKDLEPLHDGIVANIYKLYNNISSYSGGVTGGESIRGESGHNNNPYHSITKHNIILDDGNRGETLYHIANSLIKGGMQKVNVYKTLEIIAEKCNPPFDKKELPARIESAIKRVSTRERSLTDEVREFIGITNGFFSVSNVAEGITFHNKAQLRVILHRLAEKGLIEKDKNRDGLFRRVDNNIEPTNWIDAPVEELFIRYPFEIHKLFITRPKNIIIVAGTSDGGKTAFLLNFVDKNCEKFKNKINYFSSEMGPDEMKSRMEKFSYQVGFWKDKFNFYERPGNFADVIKPDEINIIDYLDITDEFYKVGTLIKDIFDKLRKGIAIIALQKNPEKELGRGGALSIEKARLYLSIDPGKITIKKAKNWRTDVNPSGQFKTFKLVGGCKFSNESGWDKALKDCDLPTVQNKYRKREPGED